MKKIVYVIIGILSLVIILNISANNQTDGISFEQNGKIIQINPIY